MRVRPEVVLQPAAKDHVGGECGIPSHQHSEAGGDDGDAGRLGEEVVRTGVEQVDLVELSGLGGEHQDRGGVALVAEAGADGVAVHSGQQQVEHDRRVPALERLPQPGGAIGTCVDLEALGLQAALHDTADRVVVLDHQYPHAMNGNDPWPPVETGWWRPVQVPFRSGGGSIQAWTRIMRSSAPIRGVQRKEAR